MTAWPRMICVHIRIEHEPAAGLGVEHGRLDHLDGDQLTGG
ncbi:hypothetical protein SHJGH_6738 [Streptomyces hygroscopicus subsp. jinggangensis TL01]|nr:hypothetical protein SHJGH_6738 [Streptomyces hygroscopicus subsp. jinggangensis TL01]